MAYENYPGFVSKDPNGGPFYDELQELEAETRRAKCENRDPIYTNIWLDLHAGRITWNEYLNAWIEEKKSEETEKTEETTENGEENNVFEL
jgi:hypothetical protein